MSIRVHPYVRLDQWGYQTESDFLRYVSAVSLIAHRQLYALRIVTNLPDAILYFPSCRQAKEGLIQPIFQKDTSFLESAAERRLRSQRLPADQLDLLPNLRHDNEVPTQTDLEFSTSARAKRVLGPRGLQGNGVALGLNSECRGDRCLLSANYPQSDASEGLA